MTNLVPDLPPGEWSLLLVGAWWPALPSEPTAGKAYWSDQADVKGREAEHVQIQRTQLGSRNHGRGWLGRSRSLCIVADT